jgi:hypothetical protein
MIAKLLTPALVAAAISQAAPLLAQEIETGARERRELDGRRDQDRLGWYVPDFVRLGTGGFVGMFVAGTGYALFQDVLNVSFSYGFTPASHAGADVHAFALALDARPFDLAAGDFRIVPLTLGPGLIYAWGDEFFSRLPGQYRPFSDSYYPPTSLQPVAKLGFELDYLPPPGFFERHGVYYELTALYLHLRRYFSNRDELGLEDALSSGVGYRAAF